MIQRFFHPIGQGAFYSERHTSCNINIVYDCGTTNPRSRAKQRIVNQSFRKDEIIHILFISHFDKDHISLIDTLKKTVQRIERVVIPLLHNEEKIFLSSIYRALGENRLANLVSNPNEFFGGETQIIEVQPSSQERIVERESVNVSEKHETVQKVSSGTPITLNDLINWAFIPFNHKYEERNKEFIDKLQEKDVDICKLKTDPKYILNTEVKKTIKDIYKDISGNINDNSMFLYSGPFSLENSNRHYWRGGWWRGNIFCWHFDYYNHPCHSHRVACVYTGDGDLNQVDVKTIYSTYWDLIGTIQIPHHGSSASFNAYALNSGRFLCPISVGNKNSYGHPSQKVISEILLKRSYPILVTESVDSTFVEMIEYLTIGSPNNNERK